LYGGARRTPVQSNLFLSNHAARNANGGPACSGH
jgi:hypothetical protein